MNDAKAVGVDRGEMLTPVDDRDIETVIGKPRGQKPANRACTDDCDFHAIPFTRIDW